MFVFVVVSFFARDSKRAREVDTVEGLRTRQLAQTEKQPAVALMLLFPFFVRDGCRSPHKHRALRMLPFAEQGQCSLVLLGTRCTAACGFQQQSGCVVLYSARSASPALQHHLTSPDLRSRCFLSSGSVGCASAMRSRLTARPAQPCHSCPLGSFAATLPMLAQ